MNSYYFMKLIHTLILFIHCVKIYFNTNDFLIAL